MARKSPNASTPLSSRILALLSEYRRPLHPRELAARLGIEPDELDEFLEQVDALVLQEHLEQVPGGRVRLGQRSAQRSAPGNPNIGSSDTSWDGVLSVNPRGFGFVTAVGRDDVFIPPDAIYEGLHGDRVTVRIQRRTAKGLEGRVEAILKRRNPRIAGVIQLRRKGAWLEPDDSRIRSPIILREGFENARDGDAAVVEIVRFPMFAEELAEARVVEVLGPQGDPRTEVQKILLGGQIEEQHSAETLKNAEEMATRLRRPSLEGRRDLRAIPLPTIDPEDARDHDDAIWVERKGSDYRVYVAIADVSEYVQPGSALDEAARARGCTIYLPDRAIPMLPRALAADLCSLLPEVDRYCLCVIAELDAQAKVTGYELVEGVMRSAARLTYGGVARTLGFDPESPQSAQAEAMKADLEVLAELSNKLRKKRLHRGSLDLDLPEPRVTLDEQTGMPVSVTKRATRPGLKKAYSLVEEMMLLANDLVAEWLTKKQAPTIYRVHAAPDPQRLERLGAAADKLGIHIDLAALENPQALSQLLEHLKGHPRSDVLSMLLLRSLKQAQYDIDNVGHYGLASPCYLHFTSPIRRYPDLCVHRQIKSILRGVPIDRSTGALEDLRDSATESSTRERAAMDIEREVVDLYRAVYMSQHIGEVFEGKVTGITGTGVYVALDEPFCDILVRFEVFGPDRYEVSDDELSVVGARSGDTVTLGDRLRLSIEDAAIGRRTVYGRRELTPEETDAIQSGKASRPGRIPGRGAPRGELTRLPSRQGPRSSTPGAATPNARPRSRSSASGGERSSSESGRARTSPERDSERRSFKATTKKTPSAAQLRAKKTKSEKLLASGRTSARSASEKATQRRPSSPKKSSKGKRR